MNLSTIIETLIISPKKTSRKLARGLALAYTPGADNGGVHRFTISRKGERPSSKEDEICNRELKTALKRRGRQPLKLSMEPHKRHGPHWYTLWEWREVKQERMI